MKKQRKSYMVYCKCVECGYALNIPKKWADIGPPRCLNPHCKAKTTVLSQRAPPEAELISEKL